MIQFHCNNSGTLNVSSHATVVFINRKQIRFHSHKVSLDEILLLKGEKIIIFEVMFLFIGFSGQCYIYALCIGFFIKEMERDSFSVPFQRMQTQEKEKPLVNMLFCSACEYSVVISSFIYCNDVMYTVSELRIFFFAISLVRHPVPGFQNVVRMQLA